MHDAEAERVVGDAIGVGYRLADTAEAYGNEKGVGRGLKHGGVRREELFVTSKPWIHMEPGTPSWTCCLDRTKCWWHQHPSPQVDDEQVALVVLYAYWPVLTKAYGLLTISWTGAS